jgi:hypothetical protein
MAAKQGNISRNSRAIFFFLHSKKIKDIVVFAITLSKFSPKRRAAVV